MEKLRIDEIIDHCNRKVKWWEKLISREKFENRDANDSSDREYWEHRQVAEYLKELQQYRAIGLSPELIEAMQGHNVALIEQLAEYQKAEEQGMLFRLPCKIGDIVYEANIKHMKVFIRTVASIALYEENQIIIRNGCGDPFLFGRHVFLTKAEAEAALEKMKEQENVCRT